MKVWLGKIYDPDDRILLVWGWSEGDCKNGCQQRIAEAAGRSITTIRPVDIPTDKAGLLHWLNTWFVSGNV